MLRIQSVEREYKPHSSKTQGDIILVPRMKGHGNEIEFQLVSFSIPKMEGPGNETYFFYN